jgi:hypothetical protein
MPPKECAVRFGNGVGDRYPSGVHLSEAISDKIIESVRGHLPPQITVMRKGGRSLRVRSSAERFSVSHSRSAAFGHVPRRAALGDATAGAFKNVLRAVNDHFKGLDLQWPGLDFGPVEIRTWADRDLVRAEITDRHGTSIAFAPVAID